MTTSFTIESCNVKDGPAIAYNNVSAFWHDENWVQSWRHTTPEKHIIEIGKRVPRNLLNHRSVLRHQKAVDSTGKIIGYARWKLPESVVQAANGMILWPEATIPDVSEEEEAEIRRIAESAIFNPDHTYSDVEFDDLMSSTGIRLRDLKPYLVLDYLAVHPDNQGKGIASALVTNGLQQAQKLGLDVFVLAFHAGIRVYKRLGFQTLEQISTVYTYGEKPIPYTVCFMEYKVGVRADHV